MRCNTKQSIYYSANSLYMFQASTTPIIRSTQNCNYSHQYWSYFCAATSLQCGQPWLATLEGGSHNSINALMKAIEPILQCLEIKQVMIHTVI